MAESTEKTAGSGGGLAPPPSQPSPSKPALHRHAHSLLEAFLPNRAGSGNVMRIIILAEILLALAIWIRSPFEVLPKPGEVFAALKWLWLTQGLARDLFISFRLNLAALFWTTVISLVLSYLTVLPAFRPIV